MEDKKLLSDLLDDFTEWDNDTINLSSAGTCGNLDTCLKIKAIYSKDLLDFQQADVRRVCKAYTNRVVDSVSI